MKQLAIVVTITTLSLLIALAPTLARADTTLLSAGDFGGNSIAVRNLINLDNTNKCFYGLGDYMYTKHPDTTVTVPGTSTKVKLGTLWDAIECKKGVPGNHEEKRGQEREWARSEFGYGTRQWNSFKLGDIGIIGVTPYKSFGVGSEQYNYVVSKFEQFKFKTDADGNKVPRTDINWIILALHEPLYSPEAIGGHPDNTALQRAYTPLLQKYGGFLLQAHNHITAFGIKNNIPTAVCGGGGEGGDELGSKRGFTFATATNFGFCKFIFQENQVIAELIGTDGNVKGKHTYARN